MSEKIAAEIDKIFYATIIDAKNKFLCINSYLVAYEFSKALNEKFPAKDINIFCGLWYSTENLKDLTKLIFVIVRNKIKFPQIKLHILCNTQAELRIFKFLGINAVYCNHNAFLDHNLFKIKPNTEMVFDCVYNAVLSKFKRHQLLSELSNVALITYNFGNKEYKKELDEILTDVTWLNYMHSSLAPEFLSNNQIIEVYNQSRIGLAMSKIEGAMYASGEYLLCGLPIVSTKSKGGRDVFFTEYNSLVCDDKPAAVLNAVNEMLSRNIDRVKIREEMIQMMMDQRENFINYVNSIYLSKGLNLDIRDSWNSWFINKLRNEATLAHYLDQLPL